MRKCALSIYCLYSDICLRGRTNKNESLTGNANGYLEVFPPPPTPPKWRNKPT